MIRSGIFLAIPLASIMLLLQAGVSIYGRILHAPAFIRHWNPTMRLYFTVAIFWLAAAAEGEEQAVPLQPEPAETIRLWIDDAPGALGTADQDVPVLFCWPAPRATGGTAAVVVCPGGGYGGLADHEGTD